MAPTDQKMKTNKFGTKDGSWKKSKNNVQGVKKKRKWIPEHKLFKGSVNEGEFCLHRANSCSIIDGSLVCFCTRGEMKSFRIQFTNCVLKQII